tara:strand:- start:2269 stop:2478 length:210 start_codon:yes stop_codon:yes gene_type:complete
LFAAGDMAGRLQVVAILGLASVAAALATRKVLAKRRRRLPHGQLTVGSHFVPDEEVQVCSCHPTAALLA